MRGIKIHIVFILLAAIGCNTKEDTVRQLPTPIGMPIYERVSLSSFNSEFVFSNKYSWRYQFGKKGTRPDFSFEWGNMVDAGGDFDVFASYLKTFELQEFLVGESDTYLHLKGRHGRSLFLPCRATKEMKIIEGQEVEYFNQFLEQYSGVGENEPNESGRFSGNFPISIKDISNANPKLKKSWDWLVFFHASNGDCWVVSSEGKSGWYCLGSDDILLTECTIKEFVSFFVACHSSGSPLDSHTYREKQ